MRARRSIRLAVVTSVAALLVAVGSEPALAGGDEVPEEGLIEADDLSGDWEEGPPDEDDDDASLDEAAEEIDACQDIIEIQEDFEGAAKAEGSTFELEGQEVKSGVGVVTKKAAKQAVKVYGSGDGAECFEELLAAGPLTAEVDIETDSGEGPDVGDGSAFISAVLSGEDESTGEPFEFSLELVMVRVGKTLAIYEYERQDGGADEDEFDDAVEAAGERLEEAA
jgi:hypothetical protein